VYDLCIVGSGPAGLVVANEVSRLRPGLRLCVLESGAAEQTPFADGLRDLDSTGIVVKPHSRERVLGGASSTWAGLSAPLDEIDFERRPWVPFSGWPLSLEDLRPYYAAAAERYRFAPLGLYAPDRWGDAVSPAWATRVGGKLFFRHEEPQRFGEEFSSVFERDGVDLYLRATVIRLEGHPESAVATRAVWRGPAGEERSVRAQRFVLAAGGIENARLLLLSTFAVRDGLGNERDQVGRYLMNHPKGNFGAVVPTRPAPSVYPFMGLVDGPYRGFMGLRLTRGHQAERAALNSYLRLLPVRGWSDRPGVQALLHSVRRLRGGGGGEAAPSADPMEVLDEAEEGDVRRGALGAASAVLRDHRAVRMFLAHRLRRTGRPPVTAFAVRNFMEMAPDPSNRVALGARRDALGTPLPAVHHEVGDLDRRSAAALHRALGHDLARGGWATMESDLREGTDPWPLRQDASHHLGTTRMGDDPATSVVDRHGRVHGAPNVYVAGGSVFPTSGNANPTFTIVALAIRLAEHLVALPRSA